MSHEREKDARENFARRQQLEPGFPFGRVVAAPRALVCIPQPEIHLNHARQHRGDSGDLDDGRQEGLRPLTEGIRLPSSHRATTMIKSRIVAERERSVPTALWPDEH